MASQFIANPEKSQLTSSAMFYGSMYGSSAMFYGSKYGSMFYGSKYVHLDGCDQGRFLAYFLAIGGKC
ncbi:hypothetical protein CEXT_570071 [Caerostris extrusa]|uniref:Uncharacterized protein n=1 Tax=Caerostris extrusa TaxID=172846 RepID=A0AAV4P5H3_CAEEX|nr:hypothetical protein CEXT_570071 [Caerostris extrusa]